MRLILDTHIFLWAVAGSTKLKSATRDVIASADTVLVSAVSVWEVAIKARLGRIEVDADALASTIEASGFVELPVRSAHAARVAHLPLHHSDPFDRLLIAQALTESAQLVTADAVLAQYTDLVMCV